jgi:putative ABC transport system permease protein
MNFFQSLQIAVDNLRANKMRSTLTVLGIVIGVSAVIMMVAIMQGFSARFQRQIGKLGTDLIFVAYNPDAQERKKLTRQFEGLKMADVEAIRQNCDLITAISPEMPLGNNARAKYAGIDTDVAPNGVLPDYEQMRNVEVARGRFISQRDVENWAPVCAIGDKVREELFGKEDPLGKSISINGQNVIVVGVLAAKGRTFEGDEDKKVFLPLSTVQKRFLGSDVVGVIFAQPKSRALIKEAKEQLWETLMRRYDNLPGWKVDSFDSLLDLVNQFTSIFTIVLGSIASLALLVGGIGVMNIMLVSVTERTREIGIRKAVGAKSRDILLQFLVEAATLTGFGGLAGVGIGTGTAYLIGYITTFIPALVDVRSGERGMSVYVPPFIMIGAFLFSAGIGIFFGVYPAIRASKLDPIQALRHE